MATKTLTTEAIALTEKKMDMTLDEIIKISKKTTAKERRPPRASNKSRGFLNGRASQGNSRVQQFMDCKSFIRQGILAQRRSNYRGNRFPLITEVARKAAVVPIGNRVVKSSKLRIAATPVQRNAGEVNFAAKDNVGVVQKQRPQTLDALFAGMKERRMMVVNSQQMVFSSGRQAAAGGAVQRRWRHTRQQQQWGRGVVAHGGSGCWFGNSFAR